MIELCTELTLGPEKFLVETKSYNQVFVITKCSYTTSFYPNLTSFVDKISQPKIVNFFLFFLKCFFSINVLPILLSFLVKNVPKVRSNPIQVRCKRSGIGRTRSRRFAIVKVFLRQVKKFFLIGVNSLQKYSEVAFKRVQTSLNKVFVIIFIVVVVVVAVVVLKMKTFSFILMSF